MFLFYFWDRETECEWGRGRERGRHRIWSRLQAPSHHHRAQHRAQTHVQRDHDLSQSRTLNGLSHPGAPHVTLVVKWEQELQTNNWLSSNLHLCSTSVTHIVNLGISINTLNYEALTSSILPWDHHLLPVHVCCIHFYSFCLLSKLQTLERLKT